MSPDQLAAITAFVGIAERVANWPFASLFLVLVIGPWVLSLVMSYKDRQRLDQVVAMYEANVHLVRSYEKLSTDQSERISLNTEAWVGVRDAINRNEFCPVVRTKRTTHQSIEFETHKEQP